MNVRQAKQEDIGWILEQFKYFSDFLGTKKKLYKGDDEQKEKINAIINDHVFLISHDDKHNTGLISGYMVGHPFNSEIKLLVENFWWVDSNYRNTRAGLLLLNRFLEIGKEYCDWIIFTLLAKSPISDAILLRKGFKRQENNYLLEV